MIPTFGVAGFTLFALMAMMVALSLVPVSLGDRSNPTPPEEIKFSVSAIWAISPVACIGCITIGLTNSAFRLIGPIYAGNIGMDTAAIALFISAGIVGGAVLQYPLGWLSDRLDRRWVLIVSTSGAVAAGLFLSQAAGTSVLMNNAGVFAFGAFALPLYSLSAAHANDRAKPGQYVLVAAGLSFFFSLGASIGPVLAAWVMKTFGVSAFFTYTSVVACQPRHRHLVAHAGARAAIGREHWTLRHLVAHLAGAYPHGATKFGQRATRGLIWPRDSVHVSQG